MTEAQLAVLVLGSLDGKITLLECGCCIRVYNQTHRLAHFTNRVFCTPPKDIRIDCDSALRFLLFASGNDVQPIWGGRGLAECGEKRWQLKTWHTRK